MSRRWKWFLLGYLWALPNLIIMLGVALVLRAHSWRWSDGAIECVSDWMRPLAMCWGAPLIVYSDEQDRDDDVLRVHERAHLVQGMWWGVLFLPVYGAAYVLARARGHDHYSAYQRIFLERHARRAAREMGPDTWGV